ncbi:hypothetical protein SPSYN_02767 [Sporotomaculum syntrophicum]|uniref:DUF1694 domain-containing protein n=1 Tax=Sporotomaculum syntrophicum TaxID=182264 RepID=A0A9D3AVH2_9FIRM|nr:YueI family protein [Sporotomaculum syntrophicum]KAF1084115.1 hypothetical protein SPSYN_02767 [Sporotomaculum syntrophicum]
MMASDLQRDEIKSWVNKDSLAQALAMGMHGAPEIKRDEKNRYLGEFRERVIRLLSKKQVAEPAVYPEILESLKDPRAAKMIISGDINYRSAEKYRELAEQVGKICTVIHDPAMTGDTGLVIVSSDTVDVADIFVPDRKTRLERLGVPAALVSAAGKKVCDKCYEKITGTAPSEAINYSKLTLADRFWGDHCVACDGKHGDD